jgi:hypothetical protein
MTLVADGLRGVPIMSGLFTVHALLLRSSSGFGRMAEAEIIMAWALY